MEQDYQLLPVLDFFNELTEQIKKAQKRVYIQAMIVEIGQKLSGIGEALKEAASRGVDVEIHIDYMTKIATLDHANYIPVIDPQKRALIKSIRTSNDVMLQSIINAGGKVVFINKPKTFIGYLLYKTKRNHIKLSVVDDIAYMGGTNFYDKSTTYVDFMMKFHEPSFVNIIKEQFFKVDKNSFPEDKKVQIDDNTSLFIDVGNVNKSIIYDEALSLIKNAKEEIIFASQFLPDFDTLKLLKNSKKKGVSITVITHHPKFASNKLENIIDRVLYTTGSDGIPFTFCDIGKVHTKLLYIDRKNNPTLMFGSHNYSKFGVLFGTNEIALETKDPKIIMPVDRWYNETFIHT